MHELPGWTLVEELGRGGMCVVYRAHRKDDPTDEHALKVLVDHHDGAHERFLDEGRLLMQLDHPNILRVQEVVDGEPPWMVTELLAGRDLAAIRDAGQAIAPEVVARWFADLAQGLQLAHDRGIVHRDIKPSNVMLAQDGVPHLIDFGIARQVTRAHKTRTGVVMGTVSYLPPELFLEKAGKELQDQPAADVYALGQTLCEVLVGRAVHPAEEIDGPHMLIRIMKDKIARPHLDPREWSANVPDDLADIVVEATRQEPSERLPSAGELARRLQAWQASRENRVLAPVSAIRTLFPLPGARPRSGDPAPRGRRPLLLGLAGLTLFVGVCALLGTALVGGIGALFVLRPDPAVRVATRAVQAQLPVDAEALRACVDRPSDVSLDLTLEGGSVVGVQVEGVPPEVADCLADRVRTWSLRAPDAEVRVHVALAPR